MESRKRASTVRLPCRAAVRLGLILALVGASALLAAPPAEHVWITLGADAFETLSLEPQLAPDGEPLARWAERAEVIVTRVRADDLALISEILHETYRRCGGFMAHASLALARETLERSAQAPLDGVPIVLQISHPERVQQLEAALDPAEILATIEALSTEFSNRFHAHPSGTAAAQWIRDLWQGYAQGRPEVTVELFAHPGVNQPSVILTFPGSTLPDEVVVLGGHLDSIAPGSQDPDFSAPGADDDASGIAVLSEVIRVAIATGFRPQRTVSFMGYAAEEVGLVGSQNIAVTYDAAGTNVVAVLQLDLTAFEGSNEDIFLYTDNTNATLTAFLGDLLDTYQPHLAWTTSACGFGCSDHVSWHIRGYPAAFPVEARFGEHNPWIHTTSDTLAGFGDSAAHAHKFARLAAAFLVEIGLDSAEVVFADGFESGTTASWAAP